MNSTNSGPGKVWLIGELQERVEALDPDWSDVQVNDQLRKILATVEKLQRAVAQRPGSPT